MKGNIYVVIYHNRLGADFGAQHSQWNWEKSTDQWGFVGSLDLGYLPFK